MFVKIDQVMNWMKDHLTERTEFGFQYVDFGDPDDIIPGFPSVIITNNSFERVLTGTHKFGISFSLDLWVLHANATTSSALRRMEDIALCNQIQDFLDLNLEMPEPAYKTLAERLAKGSTDNIIQGWVSAVSPGVLARKGALIAASRITWDGVSQQIWS